MKELLFRMRTLLEHPPAWESVSWWDDKGEMQSEHHPDVFQISLDGWRKAILYLLSELEEKLHSYTEKAKQNEN